LPTFFFVLVFTRTSDKFSITFAVVVVVVALLLALLAFLLVVVLFVALFLPVKDDDGFEDDFFSDDDDDVAPSSSSAVDALGAETRLVVLFAVLKQTPPNPVFLGKIEEVNRDDMVFETIIFLLGRLSVVLLFSSVIAKRLRVNV